jgi:DNA (cytosine-5)-methyltransferase 1
MIKTGSDFSGVGAFDQALIRLNIPYETVFACDMDKFARKTYIANYGEPDYYPENVYNRDIPTEPLDIYMTSPPCQSFSLAGKRKGKDSKNGILFFNSHEFIKSTILDSLFLRMSKDCFLTIAEKLSLSG